MFSEEFLKSMKGLQVSDQPMIGDELKYYGSDDIITLSKIKEIGWKATPNGGKVLFYTTELGDEVVHTKVISFHPLKS